MKHMKIIDVPATTREVEEYTTCDLCREKITEDRGSEEKVEISRRTGDSCPDGGSGDEIKVDLCCLCFDTKLKPWFESQGVVLTAIKWDW